MAKKKHAEQDEEIYDEPISLRATYERLTDEPMRVVWRFVFAALGGWLGMGGLIFAIFRSEQLFSTQRISNALVLGLTFGMMIGVLVLLAGEYPSRLRGMWPLWMQLLVWGLLSILWATLTWAAYHMFFINDPLLHWDIWLFGGVGLALGFLITALFNLPPALALVMTVICIYLPVYISYQNYIAPNGASAALLYFNNSNEIYRVAFPFALISALGGHLPLLRGRDAV